MNGNRPALSVEPPQAHGAARSPRHEPGGDSLRRRALSRHGLRRENREFCGTGGRSEENRGFGFRPGFFDTETRTSYLSCFRDGAPAPCHLLDGLPDALVTRRDGAGRAVALRPSVVSGFLLDGRFYSREEAARKLALMETDRDAGADTCLK